MREPAVAPVKLSTNSTFLRVELIKLINNYMKKKKISFVFTVRNSDRNQSGREDYAVREVLEASLWNVQFGFDDFIRILFSGGEERQISRNSS